MAVDRKSKTTAGNGKTRLFETRIDIPQEARTQLVTLLNQQLANTFDLFSQTKQAHWNVKGRDFYQLHELFDRLAEMIFPFVDEIAERVTTLGGLATGTARMAAQATALPEYPEVVSGEESLTALVERYGLAAESVRECIDQAEELEDKDTADLLTEYSRELDKALWFIEAHLQDRGR